MKQIKKWNDFKEGDYYLVKRDGEETFFSYAKSKVDGTLIEENWYLKDINKNGKTNWKCSMTKFNNIRKQEDWFLLTEKEKDKYMSKIIANEI